MRGGFVQSLKRSVFGGESFFLNRFIAREPGSVTFAPRLPGDVIERDLGTEPLFVQSSSFLAGTPGVEIDTKFGGFKTFFAGEGLFLLRLTGPGRAFLSSFGAIDEIRLGAGEEYVVDTGHVVAFESSIPYSVRRVGGLASTVLSGEGLVVEFEGPGTVWTQSRSPDAFLSWIAANAPSGTGAVVPVDYSSDSTPTAAGVRAGLSLHRAEIPRGPGSHRGEAKGRHGEEPRHVGDATSHLAGAVEHHGDAVELPRGAERHRTGTEGPPAVERESAEIAGRRGSRWIRMQESVDRNRDYAES